MMSENLPKALRRYPYFIGLVSMCLVLIFVQLLAVIDSFFPILIYEVDAVSAVMSTCSEVIAGLYGITLTGYIFFADRFQNTSKVDESLYDAVQALLLRYNHLAGFISLLCLICIVSGELIVLYGNNTIIPRALYRLWINETLVLYFGNFNLILYFVISVLDPHKVARISKHKKAKLSMDKENGDPEAFMADWKSIEESIFILRDKLTSDVRFIPNSISKSKPEIVRIVDVLRNYGRISNGMWQKINKLRQYYYLTIHDPNATVSMEMCNLAKEVNSELQNKTSTISVKK